MPDWGLKVFIGLAIAVLVFLGIGLAMIVGGAFYTIGAGVVAILN